MLVFAKTLPDFFAPKWHHFFFDVIKKNPWENYTDLTWIERFPSKPKVERFAAKHKQARFTNKMIASHHGIQYWKPILPNENRTWKKQFCKIAFVTNHKVGVTFSEIEELLSWWSFDVQNLLKIRKKRLDCIRQFFGWLSTFQKMGNETSW